MGVQSAIRFDGVTEIPGAYIIPSGGKVIYVHSSGASALDQLPPGMPGNPDGFFTSLNAAFATCRDNRGDTICELPGHSESHTTATELSNIKAGVRVLGMCNGPNDMPTHRWTNTAAVWAISSAGCTFENIKLRLEGANGVVKAINVTGASTSFKKCRIQMASGASNKAVIGIEVGSGATEFLMDDCYVYGASGIAVTDGVKFVGATVPSNFVLRDSFFNYAATEVNGLVHVTVAALDNYILRCRFANTVASSTAGFVVDAVASAGFLVDSDASDLNNGTAASQGFIFGAGALWRTSKSHESNEAGKSGIASPGVTT